MRNLRFAATLLLFLLVVTPHELFSQTRRQQPKPVRKPTVTTPTPAPTFDTLLGVDTYNVYVEIRGVGQLVRSNTVNELLDPIMKLSDPPKEFKTLIKWLNTRADDVMTSRMFVAGWPMSKGLPDVLVAIQFNSADEAAKFEPQLNGLLPKLFPTPPPQESPASPERNQPNVTTRPKEETAPKPAYYLQQVGSLILLTPTSLKVKDLRPPKSKLFSEEQSFRVARNRFASEQVFAYIDFSGIDRENQKRRKEYEEAEKKYAEEAAKEAAKNPVPVETETPDEKKEGQEQENVDVVPEVIATTEAPPDAKPSPDELSIAFGMLGSSFLRGQGTYPDALGIGVSLDSDSLEVRALMVTKPGEKCDPIPFFPNLIPGAPIVLESPAILPADTELFASLSLDFPQIYAAMSKQSQPEVVEPDDKAEIRPVSDTANAPPFAEIEKRLHIKIKDDLLPLLGSEVVVSVPLTLLNDGPVPNAVLSSSPTSSEQKDDAQKKNAPSFVIALSSKDKEGMRMLLPKLVDGLGFKGASGLAQIEHRDDVEVVSYGNVFTYAFIENFLVLSADPNATRHVVDSYLKHDTLSANTNFKNYTRWQPRQLQGQIYVSPALMDKYKNWAGQPSTLISDQMREILGRLSLVAQPVTYSLSNDGLGTMHEVHIPKNLLLMAVAGIASESNPSPIIQNERAAMGALWQIAYAEREYKSRKGHGSFGTMEQLTAEGLVSGKEFTEHGYKIELVLVGDKFVITAVPDEYGKTGRTSFFMDHSNVMRAGDHGGGAATVDDNPIQ